MFYFYAYVADSNLSIADKLAKDDLENGLACLQAFDKLYPDVKKHYDCILYKTRDSWRCIIDTNNGDLDTAINLGEYSKTHESDSIDDLTVTVNVHDDGNTLELVGMCSSHGKC